MNKCEIAEEQINNFVDIYTTKKTYKTIYLDPPWMERGGGNSYGGYAPQQLPPADEITNDDDLPF